MTTVFQPKQNLLREWPTTEVPVDGQNDQVGQKLQAIILSRSTIRKRGRQTLHSALHEWRKVVP